MENAIMVNMVQTNIEFHVQAESSEKIKESKYHEKTMLMFQKC